LLRRRGAPSRSTRSPRHAPVRGAASNIVAGTCVLRDAAFGCPQHKVEGWRRPVALPGRYENSRDLITTGTTPGGTLPQQCSIVCADVGYDLYIVNPDGTERHMGTNYAKVTEVSLGIFTVGFEDSGLDFDYNDVVVRVDKRDCAAVGFEMLALDASWHHKVVLAASYKGVKKLDAVVWLDSHAAIGKNVTIDVQHQPAMCVGTTVSAPPPPGACALPSALPRLLTLGVTGQDVRDLQDLLRCLGFFPADRTSTGYYGTVTRAAVIAYQLAHGIAPVGNVGPITRASLNTYAAP